MWKVISVRLDLQTVETRVFHCPGRLDLFAYMSFAFVILYEFLNFIINFLHQTIWLYN